MGGTEAVIGALALVAMLSVVAKVGVAVWKARVALQIARADAHPVSLLGRALVMAGAIVGAQWWVITNAADNVSLLLVVLGVPALFAAHTLTKAFTVTQIGTTRRRGGRR